MKRSFKIIIVCIAIVLSGINMSYAQNGHRFLYGKPGYAGNISFAIGKDFIQGSTVDLLTSHGYSFGNGLYLGMGTGLSVNLVSGDGIGTFMTVPVFADMKYSFMDRRVSPFIALKAGVGMYTAYDYLPLCLYLAPSVGIDIGRFSIGINYVYERNTARVVESGDLVSLTAKIFDKLQFGVTYNF